MSSFPPDGGTVRLRAAWVLPICGPPLADHEVVVEDGCIVEVRPWRSASGPATDVVDLGRCALLPTFVNAHTHLEYNIFRGRLEDIDFFPWIGALMALKPSLTEPDWLASATMGAAEAAAGGTGTIADCTDAGTAAAGAATIGLRGVIHQEVFGIDGKQTVQETVAALDAKLARMATALQGSLLTPAVSPHAPYTVRPELMSALARYAKDRGLRLCIHASESRAEAELMLRGSGVIARRLADRGIAWETPGVTTVAHLARHGLVTDRTLLVHGVQVSRTDARAASQAGASWVHCPKSNAKLGNGVAPLWALRAACPTGNLGLGTDSAASNNGLDMLEEMRFAVLMHRASRRRIDAMDAVQALEMATLGGARALGMADQIGTLERGKRADLTAIRLDRLHTAPCYDPASALVYTASARDVALTMVDGRPIWWRGRHAANLAAHRRQFRTAAHKLAVAPR